MSSTPQPSPGGARTAIVTGAGTGIGRAIALALGGLGWRVGLGGRRRGPLDDAAGAVHAAGGAAVACELDMCDSGSIDAFVDTVQAELGPVDVLVNNAGISVPGAMHTIDPAELEREVRTNLLGPILLSRRVIADLLERGAPGDLVFISSDASRHPRPLQVGYTATKAGVEALAAALSLELEGSGIRCITIRPGPVLTEFAREWDLSNFGDMLATWQRVGLQRHLDTLTPADVAAAVVHAVTAPLGVVHDTIEIQPLAPRTP